MFSWRLFSSAELDAAMGGVVEEVLGALLRGFRALPKIFHIEASVPMAKFRYPVDANSRSDHDLHSSIRDTCNTGMACDGARYPGGARRGTARQRR